MKSPLSSREQVRLSATGPLADILPVVSLLDTFCLVQIGTEPFSFHHGRLVGDRRVRDRLVRLLSRRDSVEVTLSTGQLSEPVYDGTEPTVTELVMLAAAKQDKRGQIRPA